MDRVERPEQRGFESGCGIDHRTVDRHDIEAQHGRSGTGEAHLPERTTGGATRAATGLRCGAAGPGSGLHHYAFDAHGFTDLAGTADALVARGRSLLWGLGRHGPGNNLFSYYLDPDGCVVEVSFGLERIDNDDLYEPGNWRFDASSNVLDRWGSKPPEAYGKAITPFVR